MLVSFPFRNALAALLMIIGIESARSQTYPTSTFDNITDRGVTANKLLVGGGTAGPITGLTPGSGVATALGVGANASGGMALLNGAATSGHCLQWSASGIQDTGAACAAGAGTPGGSVGQVQFNSAGAFGGFTVGGDATLNTGTGALTVTKTNGVSFGALATVTPGANVATAAASALNGSGALAATTGPAFVNATGTFLVSTNAQTGTTYTIASSDQGKLVTFSNASTIAITLPQATTTFGAGFTLAVQNKGAGTATITPTTSTINGSSTLALTTNQGVTLVSDGTNWQIANSGIGSGGGGTYSAGAGLTLTSTVFTLGDGNLTYGGATANTYNTLFAGGTTTGSSTHGTGLGVTCTMNTSGVVDGACLNINVTNSGSGSGSTLATIKVGGASLFDFRKDGFLAFSGSGVNGFRLQNSGVDRATVAQNGGNLVFSMFNSGGSYLFDAVTIVNSTGTMNVRGTLGLGSNAFDAGLSRTFAGVVAAGNGSDGSVAGQFEAAGFISASTKPTLTTGSCSGSSATGGATAGTFVAATCTGGTYILTGMPNSITGYSCHAEDRTTVADTLTQTATSFGTVTFTGTTVSGDVIQFFCIGY